jgi:hypothetical protein
MQAAKTNESLPLYLLSLGEKRDALQAAIAELSDKDKVRIETIASDLVSVLKARHPGVQFTKESAFEVIAMLGIFFNRRMKNYEIQNHD